MIFPLIPQFDYLILIMNFCVFFPVLIVYFLFNVAISNAMHFSFSLSFNVDCVSFFLERFQFVLVG